MTATTTQADDTRAATAADSGRGGADSPPSTLRSRGAGVLSTRSLIDAAVVLLLAALGMIGLGTSFDSPDYLLAGFGGLVVGAGIAVLTSWLRLGILLSAGAAVLAYYLFGSLIAFPAQATAFVLPTIDTLADLTLGPVLGWVDILTLRPPVSLPTYVNAVPYVAGWLVSLVGVLLVLRWQPSRRTAAIRAALVLLGPAALYVTGVLLGTDRPVLAALRGVGFGVIALIWLGWHRRQSARLAMAGAAVVARRRLLGTVAVVAAAAVLGSGAGFVLAPPPDNRFVLREEIEPPFEPLDYPSPLAGFRKYTKDLTDTVLFEVDGLRRGQLVRLASMDTYDGVLWGVAGAEEDLDGSGAFQLVGSDFPRPVVHSGEETTRLDIRIAEYDDVWMPEAGYVRKVDFAPDSAPADLANVRYNAATGTTVLTSGVEEGVSYTVDAELQATPDNDSLLETPTAGFAPATVLETPDAVVALAQELSADVESPVEKVQAIEDYLTTNGFYSRGEANGQAPSRAGHGADRMLEMVELPDMVGDEEQYASLFGLMVRSLGYPTRVVMGFDPEVEEPDVGTTVEITGDDVTAWVEVAFEGVGWVPFFPTPDNIDVPQNQVPKPKTQPQPQVRQPPRSDAEQDDLVSPVEIDDTDDEEELFGIPGWVWILLAAILIPAAIIFIPLLIIAALKRRRMNRRRRPGGDEAAAGAWDELSDRYSELGYSVPLKETRAVSAAALIEQVGEKPGLRTIAARTDDAVFSGRPVGEQEVGELWDDALAAVDQTAETLPTSRRIVSRYRLSSVKSWGARMTAKVDAELLAPARAEAAAAAAPPEAASPERGPER